MLQLVATARHDFILQLFPPKNVRKSLIYTFLLQKIYAIILIFYTLSQISVANSLFPKRVGTRL